MAYFIPNNSKVTLLPQKELFDLFQRRNFFSQECRQKFSEELAGKTGTVKSEEKYAHDYFFFTLEGEVNPYSIPAQSVVKIH